MHIRGQTVIRQLAKNWRKGVAVIVFVLLFLAAGMTTLILFPQRETPFHSDAVMVIAGSSDGRHQLGARLVSEGLSRNFVVSNPSGSRDKVGFAHCRGAERPEAAIETWCLRPQPVTTTGEALTMGELAEKENWTTATVVTSRIHARRVHTMFAQCSNLDVNVVFVDRIWRSGVINEMIHEIGGYIKFWLTNPC